MSITQQKITPGEILAHGVQSRPNKLTGTAQTADHLVVFFSW